jgi:hypothetical protein
MFDFKTKYSNYKKCFFVINDYMADDSLCIDIYNNEDGCIARITTCLCNHDLSDNQAYVDLNNCPWAADLIERLNLGTYSGITHGSGYCEYPIYNFNIEELKKHTMHYNGELIENPTIGE